MSLIEKALRLAMSAHEGQTRKEGLVAYVTHPVMVALMLQKYGFSEATIAAALTHDVLEDTSVTAKDLGEALGQEVLGMVEALSYDQSLSWEEQRKKYIETVRISSDSVKAISVADKIHNAESLIAAHATQGVALWKKFTRNKQEKMWFEEAMLAMLRSSWEHPLVDRYAVLIDEMKRLEA